MGIFHLGIFPNMQIEKVRATLPQVVKLCRNYGIEPLLPHDLAAVYGTESYDKHNCGGLGCLSAAVSLGGDGTFLQMANRVVERQVPVFGINFGHLGFLAELEFQGLAPALKNLVEGNCVYEKRHLLQGTVWEGNICQAKALALNEFVVGTGGVATLSHLELSINGKQSGIYAADGIIVATATGSTAYSLSAGGPLVQPELDVMIITPVCSHALSSRPLVIPSSELVELRTLEPKPELMLFADGRVVSAIGPEADIKIVKSEQTINFIRLTGRSYYETWQLKLIRDM